MKWKDILIGALVTLTVTVVGGIAIYYFTKEPEDQHREHLLYTVQQSASFTGGTKDVTFSTVRVRNTGGVAARNVIVVALLDDTDIRDVAIESDSGSTIVKRELAPSRFEITYAALLPSEVVTINLLLASESKPAVSVRSDESFGSEVPSNFESVSIASGKRRFLEISVPVTGSLLVALMAALVLWVRRYGALGLPSTDANNAGFVLLHQGLVDDAIGILHTAVQQGRYDPYVLSNLALCKALKGEADEARKLLRAAKFREASGHACAVVSFNEALIALVGNDVTAGIERLRAAVDISPKEIRRYCERSIHLDKVRDEPRFQEIIKGA